MRNEMKDKMKILIKDIFIDIVIFIGVMLLFGSILFFLILITMGILNLIDKIGL